MAQPRRIAIFPGSFNPPTTAHVALIQAAARHADRVVAVLPRAFPHKTYDGPTLHQRIAMLQAIGPHPSFDVQVTERGLFIDIAREFREQRPEDDFWFVCGRDAAQRIVEWDYGRPGAVEEMLREFGLLVAARQGEYTPPPHIAHRVQSLVVPAGLSEVSATEVRARIQRGDEWRHLVPEPVVPLVSRYYAPRPSRNT
jgi:nicotinate (nicotinamide) nucleotide adenylyltransferase